MMTSRRCPRCAGDTLTPMETPHLRSLSDYCALHEIGDYVLAHVPPGMAAIVILGDPLHSASAAKDITPMAALELLTRQVELLRGIIARSEVS